MSPGGRASVDHNILVVTKGPRSKPTRSFMPLLSRRRAARLTGDALTQRRALQGTGATRTPLWSKFGKSAARGEACQPVGLMSFPERPRPAK